MKGDNKYVLTADLEKLAASAIIAFAKDAEKGKKASDNMSAHVLLLAQEAQKVGGAEKAEGVFAALTRHAEATFKQSHLIAGKEVAIKQLLPFWPVVKSQVLAGMKQGIDLKKVTSVYEMTKTIKPKSRAPGGATGEAAASKITMPKELTPAWERVTAVLKRIVVSEAHLIAAAVGVLNECADELEALSKATAQPEKKAA